MSYLITSFVAYYLYNQNCASEMLRTIGPGAPCRPIGPGSPLSPFSPGTPGSPWIPGTPIDPCNTIIVQSLLVYSTQYI